MSNRIHKAYEARRRAVEAHNSIADSIEERGEKTGEDESALAKADAEIRATTEALEAAIAAGEQEARYEEAFRAAGLEPRVEERQATDLDRDYETLRAIVAGEKRAAEFPLETRAALDKNSGRGGATVPTSMASAVVNALQEWSVPLQAGAQLVTTASGEEITVPQVNARPSAALVAEAGTFGASDATFTSVALNAYKYGFISQASVELLADSAYNMVAQVAELGGQAIANGTAVHLVNGTGSSQPQGFVAGGATGTALAGQTVTADELIGIVHSVIAPYRPGSVFYMHDSTVEVIRKLKDADNNYLWRPGLQAGQPDTLLGYPVFTDPNVAELGDGNDSKVIAFGNLGRGFMVRIAGGVRVERSDEYAWADDLVSWKFATRLDSVITDTAAFKVFQTAAA